tara:strand:- start:466 stop:609 length:144 start_codon:yes stop_codon:yes gene_type:complete
MIAVYGPLAIWRRSKWSAMATDWLLLSPALEGILELPQTPYGSLMMT